MRADRMVGMQQARRLRNGASGVCALACLVLIAACAWLGLRVGLAQSASTMSEKAQAEANQASPANAPAATTDQQAKRDTTAALTDPRQKQIAEESAALLKLANSLKAEVDKTTEDTLSVAVIRQAGEIEKLAHKMRTR